MQISRRILLRAGASAGLGVVLFGCGGTGVHSAASQRDGSSPPPDPAAPTITTGGVGTLPAALPADPTRTKLGMVGDSITKASSKPLAAVLEQQGFTQVKIDAEVSRRIAVGDGKFEPLSGVKTLRKLIAQGLTPDVWVIAMGTNDVGKYNGVGAYAPLIDQMMMLPDAKVPIVWVDVYIPTQLAATKAFNLELRQQAKARGNATVVSWFDVASNPKSQVLRDDHIHPNAKGTLVFADLVSAALG